MQGWKTWVTCSTKEMGVNDYIIETYSENRWSYSVLPTYKNYNEGQNSHQVAYHATWSSAETQLLADGMFSHKSPEQF